MTIPGTLRKADVGAAEAAELTLGQHKTRFIIRLCWGAKDYELAIELVQRHLNATPSVSLYCIATIYNINRWVICSDSESTLASLTSTYPRHPNAILVHRVICRYHIR